MTPGAAANNERPALDLSGRDWLVVALLVSLLLALVPSIPFRPQRPVIEPDYRIPFALSRRYELYRRYTTLAAAQFPILLIGDSVAWGQCARRDQTLPHHLNDLAKKPLCANLGLDGMHPLALAELLEHHAPALRDKNILVQFDPLWMIVKEEPQGPRRIALFNRPNLIPRLAAHINGPFKETVAVTWSHLLKNSLLRDWSERLADSRIDLLAWSLEHPYENPLHAISATLPPSDDPPFQYLKPWSGSPGEVINRRWEDPDEEGEWAAFERLLSKLQQRGNRLLVLLGPMNEHKMAPPMRELYQELKRTLAERIRSKGIRCYVAPLLPSNHYADICHPLKEGYAELARELMQNESAWLLGTDQPR